VLLQTDVLSQSRSIATGMLNFDHVTSSLRCRTSSRSPNNHMEACNKGNMEAAVKPARVRNNTDAIIPAELLLLLPLSLSSIPVAL
jgi:hypothetical protein